MKKELFVGNVGIKDAVKAIDFALDDIDRRLRDIDNRIESLEDFMIQLSEVVRSNIDEFDKYRDDMLKLTNFMGEQHSSVLSRIGKLEED